jgi:hypothetical protein
MKREEPTANYYHRWRKHLIRLGYNYPRSITKTWDVYGSRHYLLGMTARQSALVCADLMKLHWQISNHNSWMHCLIQDKEDTDNGG